MSKRYSIAEARHNLAAIVHELEQRRHIELTRRGEPVAILLSPREYHRLSTVGGRFWEAYEAFRQTADLRQLKIEPALFADVRERAPGRDVRL